MNLDGGRRVRGEGGSVAVTRFGKSTRIAFKQCHGPSGVELLTPVLSQLGKIGEGAVH